MLFCDTLLSVCSIFSATPVQAQGGRAEEQHDPGEDRSSEQNQVRVGRQAKEGPRPAMMESLSVGFLWSLLKIDVGACGLVLFKSTKVNPIT